MDNSDYDGTERENTAEIVEDATTVSLDLLPNKSRSRYETAYKCFEQWCKGIKAEVINEDLILTYMLKISEKSKPTSLWSQYSMLKSTIMIYKNIDINYPKVIAYLKKQSVGYLPKKAKIFARSDIDKFLETANDDNYLMLKVVLIIGIAGACKREELCNLTIDDVDAKHGLLLIKIPDNKTNLERTFAVVGEKNIETYQKYIALRPAHTKHRRLFVYYKGRRCTVQPVGIQTLGNIPKKIAEFLELPNPEEYTGHSLRRSSSALLFNGGGDISDLNRHRGWKPTKAAQGCYIANSIQNQIEIANRIQAGKVLPYKQQWKPEQIFLEETEEDEEEEEQLPSFSEESVHDPNNENYGEPIIEENSNEPLKEFFNTMCLTTSKMPLNAQLKIKRAIFNTVLEAEEMLME